MASNQAFYTLPIILGMKDEYVTHDTTLPQFAIFDSPDYIFQPNRLSDLGIYTVKGRLWNKYTYTNFTFKINVTNEPPYLSEGQLMDEVVVGLNTIETITIPSGVDREGQ